MDEQTALKITENAMRDETLLSVQLKIKEAWVLVSALQLCTRHSSLMNSPLNRVITHIAMQFQDAIVEHHPDTEIVLEMGWDPEYDVSER